MIEKLIADYLNSNLETSVYLETPETPPASYVLIEKTGSSEMCIRDRINLLQNPSDKNKTVRHAIITGECGELGHYANNNSRCSP